MFTPPNSILSLPLISILILLIGFCISGCGDSDDDEVLIDEVAEPPVVRIIDEWPFSTRRPAAEILADDILARETAAFYFDIAQRNHLIGEIERGLSLIRAAYPPMNEIYANEWFVPGAIIVYPEPDFYETLKELLQDKQGKIRFETGYAEFDALNAKLGVQEVLLGGDFLRAVILFFDERLNLRVASEAYSMVKGVRRAKAEVQVGGSIDIQAFKQRETWYFIFRHGWGDCPAGCVYQEIFCFTVTGTAVERIPIAQAQTMLPFQELDVWGLHNSTPFANAPAHTWSWWDNYRSWEYSGFLADDDNLGCALLGEIEAFPNLLSVSCGYRVEMLPRADIDDYEFTGVVLLLIATQERTVIGKSDQHSGVVASEAVLAAKTAAEIENPENVYFENVLMAINPPPPSADFERWWGGVHPTFIVCWDHPETGWRSYQFLEPNIMYAGSYEAKNYPGCDNFRDTDYIQTLDVSSPLLRWPLRFTRTLPGVNMLPDSEVNMLPDSDNWRDWVDEVLPRP